MGLVSESRPASGGDSRLSFRSIYLTDDGFCQKPNTSKSHSGKGKLFYMSQQWILSHGLTGRIIEPVLVQLILLRLWHRIQGAAGGRFLSAFVLPYADFPEQIYGWDSLVTHFGGFSSGGMVSLIAFDHAEGRVASMRSVR